MQDENGGLPAPGDVTASIEEAVAGLNELDGLPVAEHVARFDAVHVALNVALSTVDNPQATG
jgi:hypothetical protein